MTASRETDQPSFELKTHESIRDVGQAAWQSLLGPDTPPFLRYEWLEALESSGCVQPDNGWLPSILTLHRGSELVAAAPAYVKGNSDGEFVFDHSWARFAYASLGIEYYPKLIVAVPFTPATGPRLLVRADCDSALVQRVFAQGLREIIERMSLSGAHVLFPEPEQAHALAAAGMAHRHGLQFHWYNRGYRCFEDFLCSFASKRRTKIRRERREVQDQRTRLEVASGSDLTEEIVDFAYRFYLSTVDKYVWGRRYLNREFFRLVCERMPESIHVVLARDLDDHRLLAGAFNLLGPKKLYGRYWGAVEERPFLHFNVCFYKGIEECIERGLDVFEPGAGGEHKLARGFQPTVTHSTHWLVHPRLDDVVRDFLKRESAGVLAYVDAEGR